MDAILTGTRTTITGFPEPTSGTDTHTVGDIGSDELYRFVDFEDDLEIEGSVREDLGLI